MNFELVATISNVENVKAVTSDLNFEIDALFRKECIQIPFPQREVRLELREEQLERVVAALGGAREVPADRPAAPFDDGFRGAGAPPGP